MSARRKPTPLPLVMPPAGYAVQGPFKRQRDWNKVGHVVVIVVAIAIGGPLIWHVIANWGA